MNLFLCGALSNRVLAAEVTGCAPNAFVAYALTDHAAVTVDGDGHAVPVVAPGQMASGLVLRDAGLEAVNRLRYYLAVFGMGLIEGVEHGFATHPNAAGSTFTETEPAFDLLIQMAGEIMAHHTRFPVEEMASRLMPARMRAELWVKAQGEPANTDHNLAHDVKVETLHRPYMNFFAVREMDLRFRKQDGTMSPVVNRGGFLLGEASAVLPYDPVRDEVLLVQQFRVPIYMGGSNSPWVWEPVAGLVDPGETPEQTAHREAMEEAGLTLHHLEALGPTHGSPGALSDRLNLFVGLTDLTRLVDARGVESEGEDIRREIFSFDALMDGIDSQQFNILPLIALGLWLARHRDRLRTMA